MQRTSSRGDSCLEDRNNSEILGSSLSYYFMKNHKKATRYNWNYFQGNLKCHNFDFNFIISLDWSWSHLILLLYFCLYFHNHTLYFCYTSSYTFVYTYIILLLHLPRAACLTGSSHNAQSLLSQLDPTQLVWTHVNCCELFWKSLHVIGNKCPMLVLIITSHLP